MVFFPDDSIDLLKLSVRASNALHRSGIHTIKDFVEFSQVDFTSMKNIGIKTQEELAACLQRLHEDGSQMLVASRQLDNEQKSVTVEAEPVKPEKVFVHSNGHQYIDTAIEDMGLSKRSANGLQREGYRWFSEIRNLSYEKLKEIRNMGSKSIDEIIEKVVTWELQESKTDTTQVIQCDILCNLIFQNLRQFMPISERRHYENVIESCKQYVQTMDDNSNVEHALSDSKLLEQLRENQYITTKYDQHVLTLIKRQLYRCTYRELVEQTPSILHEESFVHQTIDRLLADGKIALTEDGNYQAVRASFVDGTKELLKDHEYDIFIKRTQDFTLEQIGAEYGLTRERIRQLGARALRKIDHSELVFAEDIYRDIFHSYEMTAEEFDIAFPHTQAYFYLTMRYPASKGSVKQPLIDALTDATIPDIMKRGIEKAVYKDYIKLGKEYIPCTRSDISNYVLKTFATNDLTFEEYASLYTTILEDIGKQDDERFMVMERGYENKLAASDTVLWKYGKRLRYYNMKSYDFEPLFKILQLEQYHDLEYSTRKFFNLYPETMKDYDIRDEYELHNLLKKLCATRDLKDVGFGRMPNIEFGTIDRNEQVLNLLLTLAPISNMEFAKAYEYEYGVAATTVLANYMKDFDAYFYDGIYKIDAPMLPYDVAMQLKELLPEDFYFMDRIKKIYRSAFPNMDSALINPFSVKALGFRSYCTYAVSDRFSTATEFFNSLLTKADIINFDDISTDIKQCFQFTSQLYKFKADYRIVEFSPNRYIQYDRLAKNGITRDEIAQFNQKVLDFVGQGKYFTIQSITADGFVNPLDEYGFENWFYASLLSQCKNELSCNRIGGNRLFLFGKTDVIFHEFIENIIFSQPKLSMDIYELKDFLESHYGINASTYKLIEKAKNTSMYYDVISEKIYADYDIYYEEI